jgi:uncharacterized protein (TIRG00374 family)
VGAALKRWGRPVAIVVVAILAIFAVRRLDPAKALSVLRTAHLGWLLLAMVVNATLRIGTRVMRTRTLLSAMPGHATLPELAHIVYGSMALGYIASPIAGSAARVFALRNHGIPTESVVAAQLWEKVVAGIALAAFAGPMLARDNSSAVHYPLLVATILGSVGAILAFVVVATFRRFESRLGGAATTGFRRWFFGLGRSLSTLHDAPILVRAFIWSALSELADVVMLGLALHALGLPVDPAACVLGYIAVNVASAIPSTPGQIGVFEASAAWALVASGTPEAAALACGILYHLIHILPSLIAGLPSLLRMRVERREAEAAERSARMQAQ